MAEAYWLKREAFHRQAIGHTLPEEFYAERNSLEEDWVDDAENAREQKFTELSSHAEMEEAAFYKRWTSQLSSLPLGGKRSFHKNWQRKNALLGVGKKNA